MFIALSVAIISLMVNLAHAPTPKINSDNIEHVEQAAVLGSDLSAPTFQSPTLKEKIVVVSSPDNLSELFSKYASQFGVDENMLKKIAKCESNFHSDSNTGVYGGMFQYSVSTWQSTRTEMGLNTDPDLRFNAEEAIKTSAFKIAHGGLSSWPACSRI